jgi:hypothetical protein
MERVVIPGWCALVVACAPMLKGLTIGSFPHTRRELVLFGTPLRNRDEDPSPQTLASRAKRLLGAALALTLLKNGWTTESVIGDDPVFRRLGQELKVFAALNQMDAGKFSMDEWRCRCEELAIADVPLSTAIVAAAAHYEHSP